MSYRRYGQQTAIFRCRASMAEILILHVGPVLAVSPHNAAAKRAQMASEQLSKPERLHSTRHKRATKSVTAMTWS